MKRIALIVCVTLLVCCPQAQALSIFDIERPEMKAESGIYYRYDDYENPDEFHWWAGYHGWYEGFGSYSSGLFSIPDSLDTDNDGIVELALSLSIMGSSQLDLQNITRPGLYQISGTIEWSLNEVDLINGDAIELWASESNITYKNLSDDFNYYDSQTVLLNIRTDRMYDLYGNMGLAVPSIDDPPVVTMPDQYAKNTITNESASTIKFSAVPEPKSLFMIGLGMMCFVWIFRRNNFMLSRQ